MFQTLIQKYVPSTKLAHLQKLGQERRRARWPGYRRISEYHIHAYECDHVSPYTKSACNVNSPLFLILQDWSSHGFLSARFNREVKRLGMTPGLPTNRNIVALLTAHFDLRLEDTYATNLFPFIKPGGLTGPIPARDLLRAAKRFALPQVRIVEPKLVVCLGLGTFNAIRVACGRSPCGSLEQAVASPFRWRRYHFWAQAHPGHFGQVGRNRGRPGQVDRDWHAMKVAYARI